MASNFTCAASNRTFVNEAPVQFSNSRAIERAHNLSPRFGHTSEIGNLIKFDDKDDARDYTVGLLAGSIAIFCFFLLWLVTLIGLKCLGYKRVGFYSGHQVKVRKPKPTPYDINENEGAEVKEQQPESHVDSAVVDPGNTAEELPEKNENESRKDTESGAVEKVGDTEDDPEGTSVQEKEETLKPETSVPLEEQHSFQQQQKEYEEEVAKVERRLRRIRIVVLLCGLGITVCVILMCVIGIENMVDSLDSGRSGLNKAEDLAQEAIDLIDVYVERQDAVAEQVADLRMEVNGFCPNVREAICANITSTAATDCNVSGIPNGGEVLAFLNDTQSYFYDQLGGLRNDLEELVVVFQEADDASEEFYWAFYVALAFAIPLGILNLLICYMVVMAWNKKLSQGSYCYRKIRGCFLKGFVVPLFIFLVLMSWIFSMVFVIGSTAAGDMCIDSPDERLTEFLLAREDKFEDSVVYAFALWILSRCPIEAVPSELQQQAQTVLLFLKSIFDLSSSLAGENPKEFQAVCGTDPTAIDTVATALSGQVCLLGVSIFDLQDFFSCQNWHPLYEVIMYNAVCFDGTEGLSWLAATQFVIVFLTMIMLTLRVGFSEMLTEEEEAELEESRRKFWASFWRRVCHCFCCRSGVHDDFPVEEVDNCDIGGD